MNDVSKEMFVILVDGPNFINRLLDHGWTKERVQGELSLNTFCINIQKKVREGIGSSRTLGLEFFCSAKCLGPKDKRFDQDEMAQLLTRFHKEDAVFVHKVVIEDPKKEKGVDVAIVSRVIELFDVCETFVLVSSDKDFVPALEALKRKGKFVVTVGWDDNTHPLELRNAAFHFYDFRGLLLHPDNRFSYAHRSG